MLVMELCEGGCIQSALEKAPQRLSYAKRVATDTGLGLHVIHSRGMLHRDIRPQNVLLAANGRAKLADFGLVTDDIVLGYANQAGYLNHVAKEVRDGTAGTSVRSDVWAFGMTLYRIAHGDRFYREQTAPRFDIRKGGYATKLPWLPHVTDAWRRFIRKTMNDDRTKRHQSAQELLDGIAELPASEWECEVQTDRVTWRVRRGGRRIDVVFDRQSRAWTAKSFPLGTGRAKTLKSGSGESSLADFFEGFR